MNKKINLTINNNSNTIQGFSDLHINELDTLFSCSVDMIYCNIFNVFNNDNAYQILDAIIEKLRPGGQLVINVLNLKRLATLFVSGGLSDTDFFNTVRTSNNSLSYTEMIKHVTKNNVASVIDVKKDNLVTFLTISKNKPQ